MCKSTAPAPPFRQRALRSAGRPFPSPHNRQHSAGSGRPQGRAFLLLWAGSGVAALVSGFACALGMCTLFCPPVPEPGRLPLSPEATAAPRMLLEREADRAAAVPCRGGMPPAPPAGPGQTVSDPVAHWARVGVTSRNMVVCVASFSLSSIFLIAYGERSGDS